MRTQTTQRRLRTRPGSIKRNGTDGLSGLRIHDLRMVSPCSCSPCHALTLRRDRIATALPPRWEPFGRPAPTRSVTLGCHSLRRAPPSEAAAHAAVASPPQVDAPFPRAYSAYELNSAVLPSLLATPHPVHTVAKVPPVAKLPAVETSPPVARSETRATPWCRTLYVLHRIWLRREQSHDRGHDRRHLTGLDCRLRVEGCAKFERKRRRIAFRQGD